MIMVTFTKFAGSWHVTGMGEAPAVGARVMVAKRAGRDKAVTITAIVTTGARWVASIAGDSNPRPRRTGRASGYRYGSPDGGEGRDYYQNARGRCEDAPCCGCCNC